MKKFRSVLALILAAIQLFFPVMISFGNAEQIREEPLLPAFVSTEDMEQAATPSVPAATPSVPEGKEYTAFVETQYFGTAEIRLVSEGPSFDKGSLHVSEVTEEEDGEETIFEILGALQKVREPEGSVLGNLLIQTDLELPEGTEANAAEYTVTLEIPDRTAGTDVYEIQAGTAVYLESCTELNDGTASVVFSAGANTLLALEFTAENEDTENYGFIDIKAEGDFSLDGVESEPESDWNLNRMSSPAAYIPSAYSSLEEGYLPEIRDQGSFGTCWSFGTLAAAEADLIRKGYIDAEDINYSEAALVYYMNHRPTDPMNLTEGDDFHRLNLDYRNGGNSHMATDMLSGWLGAVDESNAPYSWLADNEDGLAAAGASLAYNDEAVMTGAEYYDISDRDAVKRAIMNHGALAISYYSASSSYITRGDRTYFYQNASTSTNHCVAIVGWDDSVSRYMFSTKPAVDGAWLVRNSWGEDWGSGGYFYMSYAESEISNVIALSFAPADSYDHNYYYDGAAGWNGASLPVGQKAGNIFRVSGEEGENQSLEAVNFEIYHTGRSFSLDIYTSTEPMENPEDGVLVSEAHVDGRSYTAGYYTIALPAAVTLPAGTWFSVVFKNTGTSALTLGRDLTQTGSWYQTTNQTASGQSFTWSGSSWKDLDPENAGNSITWRIKAFTKDITGAEQPTGLTLEPSELLLEKGSTERLVPVCTPAGTSAVFRWSSSDPSVASVNGSGVVTGWKEGSCTIRCSCSETVYAETEVTVADHYTVVFETWAGSPVPREGVRPGSLLTQPENPELNGYVFGGWYRDANLSQEWNFTSDTVTSNITLYAKWTLAESLTLTAESGNGILLDGDEWYRGTASGLDSRLMTTEIRFVDVSGGTVTVDAALNESWTASNGDNSIICYDTYTPVKRTLYIAFSTEDGKLRTGSSFHFGKIPILRPTETIVGLTLLEAGENLNSLRSLFEGMGFLKVIDISGLTTSGVTDMNSMFSGCAYLTTLNLGSFDTSSATDMGSMFDGCKALKTLDVSGFETGRVTDFSRMFFTCSGLTVLNVSGFDTSAAVNMNRMFYSCTGITALDVSGFDTGSVTDMGRMFGGITKVTTLDLDNFDTGSVRDMSGMFYCCYKMGALDLSSFNTESVTDMNMMFYKCNVLKELDLSGFRTENVTDMGRMFENCPLLESVDLSSFRTDSVTNFSNMFFSCPLLQSADLSGFSTGSSPVTDGMFTGCNSLALITLGTEFHPAAAVLPGLTEARKTAIGSTLDGLWHQLEVPYASYTPEEMGAAPAGTYTALPFTFYTVAFDEDGGEPAPETQYLLPGETVTEPQIPEKEGHRFLGWYLGESLYDFSTVPTDNFTLTAHWEILSYTVQFDTNGGSPVPGTILQVFGSHVTEPEGISRGIDLLEGWYSDEALIRRWVFTEDTVRSDMILYAKWTLRYTVRFDAVGGIPEPETQILVRGDSVPQPEQPGKAGFTFLGWYRGDSLYDFNAAVTENIQLTARWKITPEITRQPLSQTVKSGTAAVLSVEANGEGLTYQWQVYSKRDPVWTDCTLATAQSPDLIVYFRGLLSGTQYRCIVTDAYGEEKISEKATLTLKPGPSHYDNPSSYYTVRFNTVGGTPQPEAQRIAGGTSALQPEDPKMEGYTFIGWYHGDSLYNFDAPVTENIQLKARWKTIPVITKQPQSQSVRPEKTVTLSVEAKGNGLTYQWQYSADGRAWTNIIDTVTKNATLEVRVNTSNNGFQYRCIITDRNNGSLPSDAAKITLR